MTNEERAAILAALGRAELNDALEDSAVRLASGALDLADLEIRDRAEHELLDAARRLDCTPESIAPAMPGRAIFDDLVRPLAWKPSSAIAALSEAAALVARLPAARARFESLVKAETTWTSRLPRTNVRTLRAWLSRADAQEVALAASPNDERLVLATPDVEVSFVAPSRLVVDLLADRRPGVFPELRSASGVVAGEMVTGAEERFAFELPDALLDEPQALLVVPLARGDLEVVLA